MLPVLNGADREGTEQFTQQQRYGLSVMAIADKTKGENVIDQR
jgi:hypothetical protein